jgi:hypothetical protein
MMLFRTLTVLALCIAVFSCGRKKEIRPAEESGGQTVHEAHAEPEWLPSKPGSYWVYEQFEQDSSGTLVSRGKLDSCYVMADTMFQGRIFHRHHRPDVLGRPGHNVVWFADSSGYTIDNYGNIIFSATVHHKPLGQGLYRDGNDDTIYTWVRSMEEIGAEVIVPAGRFKTINSRVKYDLNKMSPYSPRYLHCRYAQGVGIVDGTTNFYVSYKIYLRRKLVRYHIVS